MEQVSTTSNCSGISYLNKLLWKQRKECWDFIPIFSPAINLSTYLCFYIALISYTADTYLHSLGLQSVRKRVRAAWPTAWQNDQSERELMVGFFFSLCLLTAPIASTFSMYKQLLWKLTLLIWSPHGVLSIDKSYSYGENQKDTGRQHIIWILFLWGLKQSKSLKYSGD